MMLSAETNFVEDSGSILSTYSGINPDYEYPWKSFDTSVISKFKQLIEKLDLEKIEKFNQTDIEENQKATTININTKNKSYNFTLTENEKDN